MSHNEQIDQLIDTLYETAVSAVDECVWCDLLPGLCATFGAAAGGLISYDHVSGTATVRHGYNANMPPRGSESLDNDVMPLGWSSYNEGVVFGGGETTLGTDLLGADRHPPLSWPHQLCGVIRRGDGEGYLIGLGRPARAEPFSGADREILTRLLPHLKRSLQLRDEVVHGRFERGSLLDLVDQLPIAVMLVSGGGLVGLCNHAAEDLLGRRDGICLRSGYLAGSSARTTSELRRLISKAASGLGSDEAVSGEHFVIPRGPDRLPLVGVAYPGRTAEGESQPAVVVLVKDPQVESTQSIADFIKVYSITNAEARLLSLLSSGSGLFEAATELGISKNTARTHMRSIYAKVGTHRQADLVRLLNRFNIF